MLSNFVAYFVLTLHKVLSSRRLHELAISEHADVDPATASYIDFSRHHMTCLVPSVSGLAGFEKLHQSLGHKGLDGVKYIPIFSGFDKQVGTLTVGDQRGMLDTSDTEGVKNRVDKNKVSLLCAILNWCVDIIYSWPCTGI